MNTFQPLLYLYVESLEINLIILVRNEEILINALEFYTTYIEHKFYK